MIKFENVSKVFGNQTALEEVTFEIGSGEFVFLIGPSGSGKTTLLNLILANIFPTDGEIKVAGVDLSKVKKKKLVEYRRRLGIVFQDFKLINDLTVFENVALALKVMGFNEEKINLEVTEALTLVGLVDRANAFTSQLSGGELQRVGIARAIVGDPQIVIADEPTGNLDLETGKQIVNLLKKINNLGKTVIVATHNFEIVNELKERVIKLEKGKVVLDKEKGKYQF